MQQAIKTKQDKHDRAPRLYVDASSVPSRSAAPAAARVSTACRASFAGPDGVRSCTRKERDQMSECWLSGSVPDETPCTCDNCSWRGTAKDVEMVRDIEQRLDPQGGTVPVGECPNCGALAYVDEPTHATPKAKPRARRKLRPATVTMLSDIDDAHQHLKNALALVCRASCPKVAQRIEGAIKSLGGARRHAERRFDNTMGEVSRERAGK